MTGEQLEELLVFAQANNLMQMPFQEVYNLWQDDMQSFYASLAADDYLSSIEAHDLDFAV